MRPGLGWVDIGSVGILSALGITLTTTTMTIDDDTFHGQH